LGGQIDPRRPLVSQRLDRPTLHTAARRRRKPRHLTDVKASRRIACRDGCPPPQRSATPPAQSARSESRPPGNITTTNQLQRPNVTTPAGSTPQPSSESEQGHSAVSRSA
jgi:hypothetical protein